MARPYKEVVDLSHLMADPELKKFADGVRSQIQAEYQEIFGLGETIAKRRTEKFRGTTTSDDSSADLNETF